MYALYHRDAKGTGQGQCIDMSLFEPLFSLLGAQPLVYDQLGIVPMRTGNRTETAAARNIYKAKDGRWVGVSAVTTSVLQRVMRLVGREDVIEVPWFQTMEGRIAHHDDLDEMIGGWIAEHTTEEVVEAFVRYEAVVAPVYNIADAFADPQFIARETLTTVEDARLGPARTQNPVPRLSKTPGRVRFLGPELGAHNREIFVGELGYQESDLETWRQAGII
jgi:crotonobetainyl-CoA:carnitine CoA-transferase CaiB-like acyl-CoA transferase